MGLSFGDFLGVGSLGTNLFAAGGELLGSYLDSEASRKANQSQERQTEAAIAEQRRQFDQSRADFAPYREAGVNALGQLQTQLAAPVTSADVMQDPGYQFGLDQGMQALNRRIAAGGGRISGAAIKAGQQFAQGYATQGYGAAYQRRQDALNRLAALAGTGQTATGASAVAGSSSANAISGLLSSQGDATAAARLNQGRIWGNTARNIAANWGQGPAQSQGNGIYSMMRANDPYRYAGYYGGDEGE
jgi:hypothetical protein